MNRPKMLYRYSDHAVYSHEPQGQCAPQLVEHNEYGTLWRCRTGNHDFYGYDKRKSAKAEEIVETRSRIASETSWLKMLTNTNKQKGNTV